MNKKLKNELFITYAPPAPTSKEAFLQSFNYPKIRTTDFITSQASYIRKRIWVCSSAIFFLILFFIYQLKDDETIYISLGAVSSLFPFVALLTITELARSSSHKMAELEMTTKYQLSHIVLCRLLLLGTANLLLFLLSTALLTAQLEFSFLKIGIYILLPYLLTGASTMTTCLFLKNRDALYCSSAISIVICFLCNYLTRTHQSIYKDHFFYLWIILFIILSILIFIQGYRLIKNSEELVWNLYLTV